MAAWLHSCSLMSYEGLALELKAETTTTGVAASALQSRPASLNIGASR